VSWLANGSSHPLAAREPVLLIFAPGRFRSGLRRAVRMVKRHCVRVSYGRDLKMAPLLKGKTGWHVLCNRWVSERKAMSTPTRYIILHLACTARRPATWRFHAGGILREFQRLEPRVRKMASFVAGLF
jgi:hypothetical protein